MNKKGFTLVELMVVIAIIAVLAAVAAPQVFRQMSKGRTAGVESFYNSVKTASNAYLADTARWPQIQADFTTDPGVNNWDGPYLSTWQGNNPWAGVNSYQRANGIIFRNAGPAAEERFLRCTLVPTVEAERIDADLDGAVGHANGIVELSGGPPNWTVEILISRDGPTD